MSTDYNYDDQGQFFPFFILTITGLVTLPLTYSLLKPSKELENTAPRIKSDYKPEDEGLITGQKNKQWRRERRIKRFFTVVTGYAVMGYMVYLIIVTQRITPKIWDPYSILDISRSATEKAIKKQYKKLTLKYHPDKVVLNQALNQTIEEATAYYVEISKAYKALTDEEIRNNYLQYGHPDGKQSFSIGIALPKFIIEEGSGKYVLLLYGVLLGVLLPYIVGRWWYGTQRVTKEKVYVNSAANLFQNYENDLTTGGVVYALTSGEEYNDVLKGNKAEQGLDKVEKKIMAEGESTGVVAQLPKRDIEKINSLEGTRRKTCALLWAYLGRVKLDDPALDDEKYEVAPLALALNDAFISICLAYSSVAPLLKAYSVSQHLIQATPPSSSPLLQLPHFTPALVAHIEGTAKTHQTLQHFMSLPEYTRRNLCTNAPSRASLTPAQYNSAMSVARQLPFAHVEAAFFKCRGERHIVTSSLVQFVVKVRVIPPGMASIPPVSAADLEDVDPDESDVDALLGRSSGGGAGAKNKPKGTKARGLSRVDATDIDRPVVPPLAHAPFFARDHSPRWHLFLSESKQGRVAVPPSSFSTFDRPIFEQPAEGGDGGAGAGVPRPTFHVQTFKLQFQAPPQAGSYTFVMHWVCDSYVGADERREVVLRVEEEGMAEEIGSESSVSEPDEDSLAGQMNALKQGGIAGAVSPKPRKKSKRPVVVQEDSDESDTEGEVDDDTSETDTETEEEGD